MSKEAPQKEKEETEKGAGADPIPQPTPRQPIPLSFSQQVAWEALNEKMVILVAEITAPHGLDPRRLGQEFAIDGKVIFFER
jgi:hypothetical protein